MNNLVSIVVPIYNCEKFIHKCIDSITHQSYANIEIILVDDGSTDSSSKICDEYAATDCRIVVLHKKNEGVSAARNKGMEIAHGEYILFIDADDWIDNDYIETLLLHDNFPLVVTGYCEYGISQATKGPQESQEITIEQNIPKIWEDASKSYWWFVWGKLFKREVITNNQIYFKKGMIYLEDYCFVLEYLSNIDTAFLDASFKIHHLVEKTKYTKYRMNFSELKKHLEIHNECFHLLEAKCNCIFEKMRERISFRHFYNFLLYLMFSPNTFWNRLNDTYLYISEKNNDIFRYVKTFGLRAAIYWIYWRCCAIFFKPFVKIKL